MTLVHTARRFAILPQNKQFDQLLCPVICRWQVVKFVLAVSNAIRALFARLQQRNTHLNSISLLDCLLAAHAAVSTSSESLAAAVGNAPASDTQCILQVWILAAVSDRSKCLPAVGIALVANAQCILTVQSYLKILKLTTQDSLWTLRTTWYRQ